MTTPLLIACSSLLPPFLSPLRTMASFFKKSDTSLSYSDNSLPEFETFSDHTEKMSSGSTTTHADNSLPEYDSFLFETGHDQGELTSVVIEEIWEIAPFFDTLLLFSSKNEEKVFNPGSLSSNEEKSPHLLSHRGFNASKIISDFSESPMMIYGEDIPILDVPIAPDFEASRAHGFVLRSLELQSLA
ncbi:hypothetical protein Tco_0676850 [Tanacetum coccineum]